MKRIYEESNIAAIAEKIREKTGGIDTYTTAEMPDGVADVYEAGKKAERNAFVDSYQDKGNREHYGYAYAGEGWDDETYNPNYSMQPTFAYCMFYGSKIHDIYKGGKISIDFSQSAEIGNMFANSLVRNIDVLDTSSATGMNTLFYSAQGLTTINKLVMHERITSATNTFGYCSALKNVTIEGVIPLSIDIKWSPLSVASMKSIITHLKNYAGTDKEYVNKLSFSDDCWAALEADSTSPTGTTWREYVRDLGWNT